jgi:hypothetical protein
VPVRRPGRLVSPGVVDQAALGVSLLCLVHCLALPLLFAALPALSSLFPVSETFHLWMLGIAVPASGLALVTGHARHGAWSPLLLGVTGLALLAIGVLRFGDTWLEAPVTVFGASLLAVAHVWNMRLRHRMHSGEAGSE